MLIRVEHLLGQGRRFFLAEREISPSRQLKGINLNEKTSPEISKRVAC